MWTVFTTENASHQWAAESEFERKEGSTVGRWLVVVSASPHTTTARGSNLVYKRLFIYIKEWRMEE